jgi:hypothetical protein
MVSECAARRTQHGVAHRRTGAFPSIEGIGDASGGRRRGAREGDRITQRVSVCAVKGREALLPAQRPGPAHRTRHREDLGRRPRRDLGRERHVHLPRRRHSRRRRRQPHSSPRRTDRAGRGERLWQDHHLSSLLTGLRIANSGGTVTWGGADLAEADPHSEVLGASVHRGCRLVQRQSACPEGPALESHNGFAG